MATYDDIKTIKYGSDIFNLSTDADTLDGIDSSGFATSTHTHGNITNDGKLGTASVPVITNSSKVITTTTYATFGKSIIGALSEGTSDITDNTEILTSYASNNGFADTSAKNTMYKRDAVHLYNYIKGKTDSVYLPLTGGTLNSGSTSTTLNVTSSSAELSVVAGTGDISYIQSSTGKMKLTGSSGATGTDLQLNFSSVTSAGSSYATGFYQSSDIRYKDIQKDITLSSEEISKLPIFDYTWNDETDNEIHSGTSAQDVQTILPNLINENKETGKLTLDYATLGTITGITIAKEAVKLKEKVNNLEEENKNLKNIISDLSERLSNLENKIK